MLLRRFSERFAKQDWTAIVIEFAIVVAGVFVGIQVSNWNADRADQRRAHAYLARIHGDLLTDQRAIDNSVAYWKKVIAYGGAATAYAERGELVDGSRWRTVLSFYQASQMLPFRLADSTYQELVSSGDLGLIRDEKLRSALAGYYVTGPAVSTDYILRYAPEYRTVVRGYTPAALSDYVWKHCVRSVGEMDESFVTGCESPVSEAEAQAVLDGYLAAPGILPALRFWTTTQKIAVALLESVRRDSVAMGRQVEAEVVR